MSVIHIQLLFGVRPFIKYFLLLLPLLTNGSLLADDMDTVYERRIQDIIQSTYNPQLANRWRNELTREGNWTDVDYTAGCPARRANWPAQEHFHRIITMASSFNQEPSDTDLLVKISSALDYWFDKDFHEDDCINAGGVARLNCPCGTPGFWNTNWYCQMILMPGLVGTACLLLKSNLTETQLGNCTTQTLRSYARIDGDPNGMQGPQTGANMLDVSSIAVSLALLKSDQELMKEAIARFYNESQLTSGTTDGIKVDGSFMQHSSQLYNGNYGSVFMRHMLKIFIQTGNTSLAPPLSVQSAYLTVINGSEWFMYLKNNENDPFSPILLWQFSVIGRMVSHRYEDWRGIGLSLNEILEGTKTFENYRGFEEIVNRLKSGLEFSVNPGPLVGTRFFHASDYLVHRGSNYIVTLKMFSTRTTNSECNNAQNPFGFHLSDGTIYTYINGNEYTNVYGAWNWNLIPGTTVDYDATPLACNRVQFKGKESLVGGVAFGEAGIAVMNYTNPMTGSLQWTKTYFFFPNAYAVQFIGQVISTNKSAPVFTTLDQRQLSGPVYIDGDIMTEIKVRKTAQTLWHDHVGYEFLYPVTLNVDTSSRQSNWPAIGISEGNETQNLFVGYFEHPPEEGNDDRFTYTAHLNIEQKEFDMLKLDTLKLRIIESSRNEKLNTKSTAIVRGAYYGNEGGNTGDRIVSLAFLTPGDYDTGLGDITRVETDARVLLLFQRKENNIGWQLAMSDPSQNLNSVQIRVYLGATENPVDINVELPKGAWAGSTTVMEF